MRGNQSVADLVDEALARRTRRGSTYRFFFRRLFLLGVGTTEKVADVLSAGSIGAALVVVLTLTFLAGVSVVFVRMRMVPPNASG